MPKHDKAVVVVAGHICLDVIPSFGEREGGLETILVPGKLVNIGSVLTGTGGAVSNTGLALHRLGVPTRLMGKVGRDLFGQAILDILQAHDPALARGIIVDPGVQSSYTLVINPPGVDRMFLHCPGANDTFGAADVDVDQVAGARLFHFGYPPVMRRMYAGGGRELARLLERVKALGVTSSLDLAAPDPESDAGQLDWLAILKRVLPHVDLLLPSLEETLFMVDRARYEQLVAQVGLASLTSQVDGRLLGELAGQLIDLGVAVVALKLGDQGLYLRTSADGGRLAALGKASPTDLELWRDRELLVPCFAANVVGTTGAGDCTIAGFLAGFLDDLTPERVMTAAVGVGAFSVERADSVSGVPSWAEVQTRIQAGWSQQSVSLSLPTWRWDARRRLYLGPNERQ